MSQPIPFSFAKQHRILLDKVGNQFIYTAEVTAEILAEVCRVYPVQCPYIEVNDKEFEKYLSFNYQQDSTEAMQMVQDFENDNDLLSAAQALPEPEDLLESQDDAPIIRLLNALLTQAIKENASDIHIEPFEASLSVRFRIDGTLREVITPQRKLAPLIISRIKVMAKLDISEKRLPQDGRISLKIANRPVDVRVSTLPSGNGERAVLRLLDKQAGRLDLQHLGMSQNDHQRLLHTIKQPHGIILVTGPTGSGKTTTLYAGISQLNNKQKNILTVEDPIEYYIEGIGQTQINSKINMSFARGLRAILRQDPDIIMVGEIRDIETAEIAIQASLTGHLVLSTLHTNSAVGAVNRMLDMGIEPFLLSSSLLAIIAQRLIRLLCEHCKQAYQSSPAEMQLLGIQQAVTLYRSQGCEHCNQCGYRGRHGIFELLLIDQAFRTMIHHKDNEDQIYANINQPFTPIREDGFRHVIAGHTSIEEVISITQEKR